MKLRTLAVAAAAMTALLAGCAATPGRVSQTKPVPELEAPQHLALEGYDAVAYFEYGEAQRGEAAYQYLWRGVNWYFVNAAHRDAFAANPSGYAPQYGNYCAFAVSRGTTAHGDPTLWAIAEGKLYLNNNRFAQKLWDEDRSGNIAAGDQNWPLLPKKAAP